MNPTEPNGEKIVIHWNTRDEEAKELIRKRFGMPRYTTVNGHTPAVFPTGDLTMFEETVRRGYFTYRHVDWTFNGATYAW
jgi:hypothetical protein